MIHVRHAWRSACFIQSTILHPYATVASSRSIVISLSLSLSIKEKKVEVGSLIGNAIVHEWHQHMILAALRLTSDHRAQWASPLVQMCISWRDRKGGVWTQWVECRTRVSGYLWIDVHHRNRVDRREFPCMPPRTLYKSPWSLLSHQRAWAGPTY